MSFTTLAFILFFAVVFFGYYIVPKRCQWGWLLAASMFFYAYASLFALVFLVVTIGVSYAAANWMGRLYAGRDLTVRANKAVWSKVDRKAYKARVATNATRLLTLSMIVLFGMLGAFKYLQFAFDNWVRVCGWCGWSVVAPELGWILPVGLSFYIFQSVGYLIDVYRETSVPERNFLKHALFVSFFPQILQGPIGTYGELAPQLFEQRDFDRNEASQGLQRMVWGFVKKLCIANRIALLTNSIWDKPDGYSGCVWWFFISFLYAIQIYADFSGYMDIACGCSRMLGIRLAENFNCPYFASNIPDFWRRWHMTLGNWFRDYLFYPLLRSDWSTRLRKMFHSKYLSEMAPTAIALAVVWLTTGLWHGASWGYVAWGVYFGFFIILNLLLEPLRKCFEAKFPRLTSSRVYALWNIGLTFALVVIGYSIFKPADLGVTWSIWKSSVSSTGVDHLLYFLRSNKLALKFIIAGIAVLGIVDTIHHSNPKGFIRNCICRLPIVCRWGCYLFAVWCVIFIGKYGAGLNQFEYFKF